MKRSILECHKQSPLIKFSTVCFFFEKQDGTHNVCVVPVMHIVLNLCKLVHVILPDSYPLNCDNIVK